MAELQNMIPNERSQMQKIFVKLESRSRIAEAEERVLELTTNRPEEYLRRDEKILKLDCFDNCTIL